MSDTSELKEIICPICFEPPHEPVLLLCTSHESGCRPFMCHAGPDLSNCYYKFRKSFSGFEIFSCPLCRGLINRYKIESKAVCEYFDSRPRNCSRENCDFLGTYDELTCHVTEDHKAEGSEAPVVRIRGPMTGTEYKRFWKRAVRGEGDRQALIY